MRETQCYRYSGRRMPTIRQGHNAVTQLSNRMVRKHIREVGTTGGHAAFGWGRVLNDHFIGSICISDTYIMNSKITFIK